MLKNKMAICSFPTCCVQVPQSGHVKCAGWVQATRTKDLDPADILFSREYGYSSAFTIYPCWFLMLASQQDGREHNVMMHQLGLMHRSAAYHPGVLQLVSETRLCHLRKKTETHRKPRGIRWNPMDRDMESDGIPWHPMASSAAPAPGTAWRCPPTKISLASRGGVAVRA